MSTDKASHRRLDDSYQLVIAALLRDVSNTHGVVFNGKALRNTMKIVKRRLSSEGAGFLTKTLPRLGKSLDKALAKHCPLNAHTHRLATKRGSQLPKLFGELFERVFKQDGTVLQDPCPESIRVLRQITYLYYKYELPYTEEQEKQVVDQFCKTEDDLTIHVRVLDVLRHYVDCVYPKVITRVAFAGGSVPNFLYRKWGSAYAAYSNRVVPDPLTLNDLWRSLGVRELGIRSHVLDDERPLKRGLDHSVHCECEHTPRTLFSCSKCGITRDFRRQPGAEPLSYVIGIVRRARKLLQGVFRHLRPMDIVPRHGPGAVATKQQLWSKFEWTNVSADITRCYPLDAYYYASLGHLCDSLDGRGLERYRGSEMSHPRSITSALLPARVILVPKDSRGPRLISCEPVDKQWVQQGLSRAITELVERIDLTRFNVFFTDQQPNRRGALLGSKHGGYATLDLNEASDRVSVALVRLLFPKEVLPFLMACRSSSTLLPNGEELSLQKYAPMGSALCFPILALTIWSLLTAAAADQDTADSILVFGDDVVVKSVFAPTAITVLELFGLKINRDKSCVQGFFRESCGMDAFKGVDVTPVRLRTVWSSSQSPDVYESWVAYANSFFDRRYYATYWVIAEMLFGLYGPIPSRDCVQPTVLNGRCYWPCPVLASVPNEWKPSRRRYNAKLQKMETLVRVLKTPLVRHEMDGWSMLLRYFTEKVGRDNITVDEIRRTDPEHWNPPPALTPLELERAPRSKWDSGSYSPLTPFNVRTYTRRDTGILVYRWR